MTSENKTTGRTAEDQNAIAVVGLGCRFPMAPNLNAYHDLLSEGVDAITKRSEYRNSLSERITGEAVNSEVWGSFVDQVDQFDAAFFDISKREAISMDPQHRLLLEVTWEAIENAGINLERIKGTRTGVFVGIFSSDYSHAYIRKSSPIDAYTGIGNSHCLAANRISYFLDSRGPSMAIDTSCSSSLVALHQAIQSLRTGDCDTAIVGGVNLMLSDIANQSTSKVIALAEDHHCKAFDVSADGIVRGEGCGVVVLKRWQDCDPNDDTVHALVLGSAINHDGRSNGITAPCTSAQADVISRALSDAQVKPADVTQIEAHGTGTTLGDPIEVEALRQVYDDGPVNPCTLSSVKTNLGHLESASGIAGLIKLVLSVSHQQIFPHLHFKSANSEMQLERSRLEIPSKLQAWPVCERRIAAISGFSLGGTNVHAIVAEAPTKKIVQRSSMRPNDVAMPITFSARSDLALANYLNRILCWLDSIDSEHVSIEEIASTATFHRTHWSSRVVICARNKQELARNLRDELRRRENCTKATPSGNGLDAVAWIFSDDTESIDPVALNYLMNQEVFTESVQASRILINQLTQSKQGSPLSTEELPSDVKGFVYQLALIDFYKRLKITSDADIGIGVGHILAGYNAGILDKEKAIELALSYLTGAPVAVINELDSLRATTRCSRWLNQASNFLDAIKVTTQNQIMLVVEVNLAQQSKDVHLQEYVEQNEQVQILQSAEYRAAGVEASNPVCRPLRLLSQMYCLGYSVNWYELYPSKLGIANYPGYPWQRQSYWVGKPVAASNVVEPIESSAIETPQYNNHVHTIDWSILEQSDDSSYLSPTQLNELGVVFERLAERYSMNEFTEFTRITNINTVNHIVKALARLGFDIDQFSNITREQLIVRLGITPALHRHFSSALDILVTENILADTLAGLQRGPGKVPDVCDSSSMIDRTPCLSHEQWLYQHCIENLVEVWRSRCSPVELLFAGNGFSRLRKLYREAPISLTYSALAARSLQKLIEKSSRPLRILEIGAGTGGTTSEVLELLSDQIEEYWFTDISTGFLTEAKQTFAEYTQLKYQTFNVEQEPGTQDIPPAYFDVVIAANVLHATRDLKKTMDHVSHLLVPEGTVLMVELCQPSRWAQMTFGLTQGWWAFKDHELRKDSPLLSPSEWKSLLHEVGFNQQNALPLTHQQLTEDQQPACVLMATWPRQVESAHWVLLGGTQDVARQFSEYLSSTNQSVDHVSRKKCRDTEFVQRYITALHTKSGHLPIKLLHLDACGDRTDEVVIELDQFVAQGVTSLLNIVQSIAQFSWPQSAQLWIVSRNALPVEVNHDLVVGQAPLVGLARALSVEIPDYYAGHIDLPFEPDTQDVGRVIAQIRSPNQHRTMALRDAKLWTPKLVRQQQKNLTQQGQTDSIKFKSKATYLVTGGTGGIGQRLVRWLAESGAGCIVLMQRADLDDPIVQKIKTSVKHTSSKVIALKADVSSSTQVEQALHMIRDRLPPLKGVFHTAGIYEDQTVINLSPESFARVLSVKFYGAWHLHRNLIDHELDHFVMFGSAVSVIGMTGVSAYSSANYGLDVIAHHRAALGLPALTIDWSGWQGLGMATTVSENRKGQWESMGLDYLQPSQALHHLNRIMQTSLSQASVLPLEPEAYFKAYPNARKDPFYQDLIPVERTQNKVVIDHQTKVKQSELLRISISHQRSGLVEHLRDRIFTLCELDRNIELKEHDVLSDFGLDSLVLLDLRSELTETYQIDLPPTLFLDHLTFGALIDFIACQISDKQPQPSVENLTDPELILQEIDQLTEKADQQINKKFIQSIG